MAGKLVMLAPDREALDGLNRVVPEGVEVDWVDSTQSLEQQAA